MFYKHQIKHSDLVLQMHHYNYMWLVVSENQTY